MVMHELEHQGQKLQDVLDKMSSDDMLEAMSDGHTDAVDSGRTKEINAKPLGESAVMTVNNDYTSTRQAKKQIEKAEQEKRVERAKQLVQAEPAVQVIAKPKRGRPPGRPRKSVSTSDKKE